MNAMNSIRQSLLQNANSNQSFINGGNSYAELAKSSLDMANRSSVGYQQLAALNNPNNVSAITVGNTVNPLSEQTQNIQNNPWGLPTPNPQSITTSQTLNSLNNNNNNNSYNSNTGNDSELASLLFKHEGAGNYDTLFGHAQRDNGRFAGTKVSQMTLGQLYDFSNPRNAYAQSVKARIGRVATPMGAGQIVGTTLRRTAKAMGLSDDTVFSPQVQNQMINYLAMQRINKAKTMNEALYGLKNEWEGFKNADVNALKRIVYRMSGGRLQG